MQQLQWKLAQSMFCVQAIYFYDLWGGRGGVFCDVTIRSRKNVSILVAFKSYIKVGLLVVESAAQPVNIVV